MLLLLLLLLLLSGFFTTTCTNLTVTDTVGGTIILLPTKSHLDALGAVFTALQMSMQARGGRSGQFIGVGREIGSTALPPATVSAFNSEGARNEANGRRAA